jgi:hypothetical protein
MKTADTERSLTLTWDDLKNTVNIENSDRFVYKDTTFTMNRQLLTGQYGQYTISGVAPEGKVVKGWKVTTTPKSGSKQTQEYEGHEFTLTIPTCKSIAIEAILDATNGIQAIQNGEVKNENSQIYDLLGNKVKTPKTGRLYIQNGKKVMWR